MVAASCTRIRKDEQSARITERFREICSRSFRITSLRCPACNELFAGLDSRGIPHAILTNGWSPLQEKKAEAIDLQRTGLVSDAIGFAKPAPEAFALLARYVPDRSCIWYVGDNPAGDVRRWHRLRLS